VARIYTRTGDDGYTFCAALRERVPKDHPLIEFVGSLDEANSFIGLARSLAEDPHVVEFLERLQRVLFEVGFLVAGSKGPSDDVVEWLESETDKMLGDFRLERFILPGGPPGAAAIHAARAVLRRAERRLVAAAREGHLTEDKARKAMRILNRASDALFAAAIKEALAKGELEYV